VAKKSQEPALSFGQAAAGYDSIRPTYPAEAIRWTIGEAATGPNALGHVVDLGAGTGLLTRVILGATDARVTAVEPDPLMRERLAATTPSVTPLAGSAESIPLADASVDAVLVGQAYHWFDPDSAHAEIARVVRPGGVFGPIWNIRDESVGWVAEFTKLIDGDGHEPGRSTRGGKLIRPDFGPGFGPISCETFRHSMSMNADGLVALVASRSYYLTASPDRQAALTTSIRSLADTLPATFAMPYVTYCYRSVRN